MNPKTIGIPRAFYYYSYPGLFQTLFSELGIEVVVSERSTKRTIEKAAAVSEAEHCLPNKLFDGHVAFLLGKVDAVFIPRIISMVKGHISCPRFGALPDATRAWLAGGLKIITVEINETRKPLKRTLIQLGRQLGASRHKAVAAANRALQEMKTQEAELVKSQIISSGQKKYLLLGHPYTLSDAFICDPIIRKLKRLDIPVEIMTFEDRTMIPKDIMWCTFHKMHRKLSSLDKNMYAGVIQISTFNCGADSMMIERFRLLCKHADIPYMVIMVDEHSAQAGVDTRLEAFVDSLAWREARRENQ